MTSEHLENIISLEAFLSSELLFQYTTLVCATTLSQIYQLEVVSTLKAALWRSLSVDGRSCGDVLPQVFKLHFKTPPFRLDMILKWFEKPLIKWDGSRD